MKNLFLSAFALSILSTSAMAECNLNITSAEVDASAMKSAVNEDEVKAMISKALGSYTVSTNKANAEGQLNYSVRMQSKGNKADITFTLMYQSKTTQLTLSRRATVDSTFEGRLDNQIASYFNKAIPACID